MLIVEVGGTVGDIESLPFLEAIRQLRLEVGPSNAISVHVTLVPYIGAAGELKTKPTQHSVMKLREIGIQPEILLCRCGADHRGAAEEEDRDVHQRRRRTRSSPPRTSRCIYEVPIRFHEEGVDDKIGELLNIWSRAPELTGWERVVHRLKSPQAEVDIGLVGKYVDLVESYKSLNEALIHGGIGNECRVNLHHIDSEEIEKRGAGGAAGGRWTASWWRPASAAAASRARSKPFATRARSSVPFFGICLGHADGGRSSSRATWPVWRGRTRPSSIRSRRIPVVDFLPEQRNVTEKGATMRLGAYPCVLAPGSKAAAAYGAAEITERHRHRYEVNNDFREALDQPGDADLGPLARPPAGRDDRAPRPPLLRGCQFHPEFKSRPQAPHPLFQSFVAAALPGPSGRPPPPLGRSRRIRHTVDNPP